MAGVGLYCEPPVIIWAQSSDCHDTNDVYQFIAIQTADIPLCPCL